MRQLFVIAECVLVSLLVWLAVQVEATDSARVGCLDEQGNPVDWYIGYKFPKIKDSKDDKFESGYAYAYFTSEDAASEQQDDIIASVNADEHEDGELTFFVQRFKHLLFRYVGLSHQADRPLRASKRLKRRGARSRAAPAKQADARWSISDLQITDPRSVLMRTVEATRDERVSSILYNDDSGETELGEESLSDDEDCQQGMAASTCTRPDNNWSRAHAKGVLMMDDVSGQGVWVSHSIPKFPTRLKEPLDIPESAQYYGQTFMCITFDLNKTGKLIVEHLRTMQPQVYDRRVNEKLYEIMPNLRDLDIDAVLKARGKRIDRKTQLAQLVTTSRGQPLNIFSKSRKFGKDLYSGWVDEELGSALYVETWRRGPGNPLDSFCPANEYHINNVKDLKLDSDLTWSYMNDHSKWAISDEKEHAYFCVGDSNRMASQFKRGGGAVCIKCPYCWSVFNNMILDVEPCPAGSRKENRKTSDADTSLIKKIARILHIG